MQVYFLAIGELLADVMTAEFMPDLSEARKFEIYQGGSPANVSANLCHMGKKAVFIGCVGNDGIGKFLLKQLTDIGLNESHVQISDRHATSVVFVTRTTETPEFIAYRMADRFVQKPSKELIQSARILHTTAFALSLQPARDVILNAIKTAKKGGKVISIDWNFAPEIWGKDNGKSVFKAVMLSNPLLKISLDDLARFLGEKNIDEYKTYLDRFACTVICITCGKDGVWYKKRGKKWKFMNTIAVEQVVDTTGAGDAFWAGFIAAYLDDSEVGGCINNALQTAAEKIQRKGPLYNICQEITS